MKKVSIWILALALLLSMTACHPTVSPAPPPGDITTTVNGTTTDTTATGAADDGLYHAVGTGMERPENHTPAMLYTTVSGRLTDENDRICVLQNRTLQDEINRFIDEAERELAVSPNCQEVNVETECINGYLSVMVRERTKDHRWGDVRTALYDLVTGEEITYSDLFFRDTEYMPLINRAVQHRFRRAEMSAGVFGDVFELKHPFMGLRAEHDTFTLQQVVFGADSYYTNDYVAVSVPDLYEHSVLSVPRDISDVFTDEVTVTHQLWSEDPYGVCYPLLQEWYSGELLDTRYYDAAIAEKINTRLTEIYTQEFSADYFDEYYNTTYNGAEGTEMNLSLWGGRWLVSSGGLFCPFGGDKMLPATYDAAYYFDMQSGEEVTYEALLEDGWEEAATWYRIDDADVEEDYFSFNANAAGVVVCDDPDTSAWRFRQLSLRTDTVVLEFERMDEMAEYLWAELPLSYLG